MLPLLAEFTPLAPSTQIAIVSLLGVVVTLVSLWSMLRRRPPLDAHLAKFEAALEGLRASVDELTEAQKAAAEHSAEIRALKQRVATLEQLRDMDAKAQRDDMRTNTRELFQRIESVEQTVAKNFQLVERALGKVEGQLAGKS